MSDMTRKRAISEIEQIYGMLASDKQRALDVAINSLKIDEQYDLAMEQAEPKTGHWIKTKGENLWKWPVYECSECHEWISDLSIENYKYCFGCGARMEGEVTDADSD